MSTPSTTIAKDVSIDLAANASRAKFLIVMLWK
jgi:hypothetical protein